MTRPRRSPTHGYAGAVLIAEWLGGLDVEIFRQRHFQRAPLANVGTAASAVPLLDWHTMGRVLGSASPLDLVTVAAGRLVDVPLPHSLAEARALLDRGVSVVVRDGERHDLGLRALAGRFEASMPGDVHVQLYATPAGTHSYGWHYDFEDVFIAQTAGVKDYYFRANTVATDTRLGEVLDFQSFGRERTPIFTTRLLAADCLYIPSRWWHLVTCAEDALSISVGVMPPAERQRAAPRPLAR